MLIELNHQTNATDLGVLEIVVPILHGIFGRIVRAFRGFPCAMRCCDAIVGLPMVKEILVASRLSAIMKGT